MDQHQPCGLFRGLAYGIPLGIALWAALLYTAWRAWWAFA